MSRTLVVVLLVTALATGFSSSASADVPSGSPAATVQPVSTVRPITTATVWPNTTIQLNGTYAVSWQLEQGGSPVPGHTGSATGILVGGHASISVDGTGLADGSYDLVGTISVEDPVYGTIPATPFGTIMLVDTVPPAVDSITVSHPTLYPLLNANQVVNPTYPNKADFTVTMATPESGMTTQLYRGSTLVDGGRSLVLSGSVGVQGWSAGDVEYPAPVGRYTFSVSDYAGNPSSLTAFVDVSGLQWVTRTWTHTVTARASFVDAYVGRCSQIRRPSLRGWKGSLGLYSANTCKVRTWRASGVHTLHAVRVPDWVPVQSTVFLHTYGGAAKAKPRSTALVRWLNRDGTFSGGTRTPPRVGWTVTRYRGLGSVMWSDRYIGWGVRMDYARRYDLGKFRVEISWNAPG